MSKKETPNHTLLQNLVAVAYANGNIGVEEEEFLFDIADDYEIPLETVTMLLSEAEKLSFIVPENPVDREEQLVNVIFMVMQDGEIHENEYALCLDVAKKLELTETELEEAIKLTKKLWEEA